MRHAAALMAVITTGLLLIDFGFGYDAAHAIAYGCIVSMAATISATFFWLWYHRQTPLALGMGFSWAGAAGVLGWWWVFRVLGEPSAMDESAGLFVFAASYFVGAILHFRVVGRSIGWNAFVMYVPVAMIVALVGFAVSL